MDLSHTPPRDVLTTAIGKGDLVAVKKLLPDKAAVNARGPDGSLPLSTAALHGQLEIAQYLIDTGADVAGTNADGNTALHVAAFMCRTDVVRLLREKGASTTATNGRGESPIDVVSPAWGMELSDFYSGVAASSGFKLDLKRIEQDRPRIVAQLRQKTAGDGLSDTENVALADLAKRLKQAVAEGKMTAADAAAEYQKAAKQRGIGQGEKDKNKMMNGAPDSFYAIVIGRLKSKDIETGEFELVVDYVTSVYGDVKRKETILGKTVKVSGVAGPWLDKLLLIKKGETLKFRSGTLTGTSMSISPKATVLEPAEPFDPNVYPVPPAEFRGFRGIVIGTVVAKSDQGYELTLKVKTVHGTDSKNTAKTPKAIEGRLLDLRGFYDITYRKTFDDLRAGDTIKLGVAHSDTKSDTLDVAGPLEKVGK